MKYISVYLPFSKRSYIPGIQTGVLHSRIFLGCAMCRTRPSLCCTHFLPSPMTLRPLPPIPYTSQPKPCNSCPECWNGNSGSAGDIKGSLGCDGAIVLLMRQWDLVWLMLASSPGQNNSCLTFASMPFTPWCAAWSNSSTSVKVVEDQNFIGFHCYSFQTV